VSAASSPSARGAEWTRRAERGSPFLIRFIVWFSRRAGRGNARILLRILRGRKLVMGFRVAWLH